MVRLLVVAAVVAGAALIAYATRRRVVQHPLVNIDGLGLPPGIVVFTSTECRRCREALAVAKDVGVDVREVTYELEPNLQDEAGIVGVPLTLVVDNSGTSVAQFAGRLRPAALTRAVRRAGL